MLRGQFFAFIMASISIVRGLLLLFNGKSIHGYSLLVGTTATLIGAFIYGKHENRKERENNARDNPIM